MVCSVLLCAVERAIERYRRRISFTIKQILFLTRHASLLLDAGPCICFVCSECWLIVCWCGRCRWNWNWPGSRTGESNRYDHHQHHSLIEAKPIVIFVIWGRHNMRAHLSHRQQMIESASWRVDNFCCDVYTLEFRLYVRLILFLY